VKRTAYDVWWASHLRTVLRRLQRRVYQRWQAFRERDDEETDFPRRGLRNRALAVAFGTALGVASFEVLLRIVGFPLPLDLGTYLFQCYTSDYEGNKILFESRPLYINLHKPNFEARCYWNGHAWKHDTDAWGGRNPQTWPRVDVALLGDSIIYGHGVEEEQTVAHFLRARLGKRVTNLAMMGDSFPQYLARLRNFALPLWPKLIIVIVFSNDIDDVVHTRSPEMIRRFLASGVAPEANVLPREVLLADAPRNTGGWFAALAHEFLTLRTLDFSWKKWRYGLNVSAPPPEVPASVPNAPAEPPALTSEERLAVAYSRAALASMKSAADQQGSRLAVAFVPGLTDPTLRNDTLTFFYTRELCADLNLPFLDASSILVNHDGQRVAGAQLENDGHLSELGHRRLAALVARFIDERQLLAR
jgi:lysophospholipase L1-like esterase